MNLPQFDSFTGLSAGVQASANLATGKTGAGVNSAASGLDRTMKSTIVLLPGTTIVDRSAVISVDCRGGSMFDFGHTAGLTFGALPEGLTYSSELGT